MSLSGGFDVIATFALDENWEGRDALLYKVAGRESDAAGADLKCRRHVWRVETFEEADRLRKKLSKVKLVNATLQETVTPPR